MTEQSSVLRIVWAPRGGAATQAWWQPTLPAIHDTIQFGANVAVKGRDGIVEAAWRDSGWQPGLASPCLTVTATRQELRITVPSVWRAHAYLGWRDGCLLVSSDLRTLAAAMPVAQPALEGVAAFLAGDCAESGILPSLYRDIWQLQPGHSLVVRPDGQWRCDRAWAPERHEAFAAEPLEVVKHRLGDHLDGIADRILHRHDRVACLFSGGLDSSLVAATLLRREPQRAVLFNVGSALGTAAEGALRARFLQDFQTVSYSVDLPVHAGLVRSLRATNAVAPLPAGSLFSHVFEEIIAVAQEHGCNAIVTGDGGDEVFSEREEVLVDLLARRSRALPSAMGFFALRNGERGTQTLRRAMARLRALDQGVPPACDPEPGDALLGEDLARLVVGLVRPAARRLDGQLWRAGWTYSGLRSYQRAANVPQWEPVGADAPNFPVISPLIDVAVLSDALALRRDGLVPSVYWGQRKWLLRQAALRWLSPEIALHPKIGSADGQILERVRADEHDDLLHLLSSCTARRVGLDLPAEAESPNWPLWQGDGWIRAAALVAWFDQAEVRSGGRPAIDQARLAPTSASSDPPMTSRMPWRRPETWQTVALVALNLAAQFKPPLRTGKTRLTPRSDPCPPPDNELACTLVDLARRACAVPFVSGSSRAMSQALAWYLRLGGKRPVVVRGAAEGEQDKRYWIELDGSVVDVSGAERPLVADTS